LVSVFGLIHGLIQKVKSPTVISLQQTVHRRNYRGYRRGLAPQLLALIYWASNFSGMNCKNSSEKGLRSSPHLDPDLGWPWKSYRREWLIDL